MRHRITGKLPACDVDAELLGPLCLVGDTFGVDLRAEITGGEEELGVDVDRHAHARPPRPRSGRPRGGLGERPARVGLQLNGAQAKVAQRCSSAMAVVEIPVVGSVPLQMNRSGA